MVLVYINGKINLLMKVNGLIIILMDMENIYTQMALFIMVLGIIIEWKD